MNDKAKQHFMKIAYGLVALMMIVGAVSIVKQEEEAREEKRLNRLKSEIERFELEKKAEELGIALPD